MTFQTDLLKRLNEARPNNKEATHKLYVTCIRKIYEKNKKPFEDIELVKDKGIVLAVVSQFATSTMRNYFIACANVLLITQLNFMKTASKNITINTTRNKSRVLSQTNKKNNLVLELKE